ncbi:MAG: glycosyltransferase [Bacteroidetes bacterium]|nr:glycosyltransferase [Bacteroidota bacterium]
MNIVIGILSFAIYLYMVMMIFYIIKIFIRKRISNHASQNPAISIVVAMRNEASHISNLINAVCKQKYNAPFEIIVVDDNSTDDSIARSNEALQNNLPTKFQILKLSDVQQSGKKQAVAYGISHATHEVIVCTDADCQMGEYWLQSMAHYFVEFKCKLLAGPVCINSGTLLEKMQTIEMASLQGLTAASIFAGKPLMCNGANMMFDKKRYLSLQQIFLANKNPSGDDVHLLYEISRQLDAVAYAFDKSAVVYTSGVTTISELINQRTRWAGKINYTVPLHVYLPGISIFCGNVAVLFSFALLLTPNWNNAVLIILIKFVIDWLLYIASSKFAGKLKFAIFPFCCTFFAYPFYSVAIGINVLRKQYTWKGRVINLRNQK